MTWMEKGKEDHKKTIQLLVYEKDVESVSEL